MTEDDNINPSLYFKTIESFLSDPQTVKSVKIKLKQGIQLNSGP